MSLLYVFTKLLDLECGSCIAVNGGTKHKIKIYLNLCSEVLQVWNDMRVSKQ